MRSDRPDLALVVSHDLPVAVRFQARQANIGYRARAFINFVVEEHIRSNLELDNSPVRKPLAKICIATWPRWVDACQ
jgi:hypothetical protein